MPRVLTMPNTVVCGHSGTVAIASAAKLKVNGQSVLLNSSIVSKPVAGCTTTPASDNSGPTAIPCTLVSGVSAGESVKLKVGGNAVMLETLRGSTNGMVAKVTPQTSLAGSPNQNKLNSV